MSLAGIFVVFLLAVMAVLIWFFVEAWIFAIDERTTWLIALLAVSTCAVTISHAYCFYVMHTFGVNMWDASAEAKDEPRGVTDENKKSFCHFSYSETAVFVPRGASADLGYRMTSPLAVTPSSADLTAAPASSMAAMNGSVRSGGSNNHSGNNLRVMERFRQSMRGGAAAGGGGGRHRSSASSSSVTSVTGSVTSGSVNNDVHNNDNNNVVAGSALATVVSSRGRCNSEGNLSLASGGIVYRAFSALPHAARGKRVAASEEEPSVTVVTAGDACELGEAKTEERKTGEGNGNFLSDEERSSGVAPAAAAASVTGVTGAEHADSALFSAEASDSSGRNHSARIQISPLMATICAGDLHNMCSICLGEYEPSEAVVLLPCAHMFHNECLSMWIKDHSTCPFCKAELNTREPRASWPRRAYRSVRAILTGGSRNRLRNNNGVSPAAADEASNAQAVVSANETRDVLPFVAGASSAMSAAAAAPQPPIAAEDGSAAARAAPEGVTTVSANVTSPAAGVTSSFAPALLALPPLPQPLPAAAFAAAAPIVVAPVA